MSYASRVTSGLAATAMALSLALLPARAQEDTVKIGVLAALTGPVAAFGGVPTNNGMQIALEELGGRAGVYKIDVKVEDYGSDRRQAVTIANRMATVDQVHVILGPIGTGDSVATAPVVNQLQVPTVMMSVSDAVKEAGPWAYRIWQGPNETMAATADYVVNTLQPKTAGLVFMRDGDAYIRYKDILRGALEAAGVEVVTEESVVATDTNFAALATKLAVANPDILLVSAVPELSANLLIQARQAGLSEETRIVGTNALSSPQYVSVGGAAVEGTVFPADYFLAAENEANAKFATAYRAKFGSDPDQFAAAGYTMVMLAAKAIQQTGPDRDAIRQALAETRDLPTPLGAGKFSIADQNSSFGNYVVIIRDGVAILAE